MIPSFHRRTAQTTWLGLVLALATANGASAHAGGHFADGFGSGALHPVTGLDHMLAMVAVGLWGARLGKPLVWLLPVTFPSMMAIGCILGIRGVPVPSVEIGIALSAVLIGAMVATAARPKNWAAMAIIGVFAIFHGHAHGTELPASANPAAYAAGFLIATGLLHTTGITIGLLDRWKPFGNVILRTLGGAVMVAGGFFCWKSL